MVCDVGLKSDVGGDGNQVNTNDGIIYYTCAKIHNMAGKNNLSSVLLVTSFYLKFSFPKLSKLL